LIDPAIVNARGRVVNTMGDGILIEFASAVDAVRYAIDVQRGMVQRNSGLVLSNPQPMARQMLSALRTEYLIDRTTPTAVAKQRETSTPAPRCRRCARSSAPYPA